jgi:hypothetical protein
MVWRPDPLVSGLLRPKSQVFIPKQAIRSGKMDHLYAPGLFQMATTASQMALLLG